MKNQIFMYLVQGTRLSVSFVRGWGNGYVAVPKGHPWYGMNDGDINANVHGGLTYTDLGGDYWVVGFDTCHLDDTPELWPMEAVVAETRQLMEQAIKACSSEGQLELELNEPIESHADLVRALDEHEARKNETARKSNIEETSC